MAKHKRLYIESNFNQLEDAIKKILNSNEKMKLKLYNPLGIIETLTTKYASILKVNINDKVYADRLTAEPTHHKYKYIYDVVYADRLTGEPTHQIYIYIYIYIYEGV